MRKNILARKKLTHWFSAITGGNTILIPPFVVPVYCKKASRNNLNKLNIYIGNVDE
jgi:hypothetical protein